MNDKLQNQKRHDLRSFIITFVLIFAVIVGFVWWQAIGWGIFVEQPNMNKYLNEQYGQEFIIDNIHQEGAGLGSRGSWVVDAYPKSDPSLRFTVHKSQTTDKISVDTFLQTLWTKQGTKEVEAFLSKEFPKNEGYVLNITPGSPDNALYDSIRGETPSLETALKDYKGEIAYSLSINDVESTTVDEPSSVPLEKAKRLTDFVKGYDTGESYANYGYRDVSFTDHNRTGQQKYQYRIKLGRNQLQSVDTTDDLKQYFQAINYLEGR